MDFQLRHSNEIVPYQHKFNYCKLKNIMPHINLDFPSATHWIPIHWLCQKHIIVVHARVFIFQWYCATSPWFFLFWHSQMMLVWSIVWACILPEHNLLRCVGCHILSCLMPWILNSGTQMLKQSKSGSLKSQNLVALHIVWLISTAS